MPTRISVAIITLNEERNIERCLKSVSFASDVVVVDSGSSDRTLEIAKAYGAKIHHQSWLGFGPQKNKAIDLCESDWILSLDADEALDDQAIAFLKEFQTGGTTTENKAFRFARLSFYMNRWIRHGGWYPDLQLRFFNRKHWRWSEDPVHEKVTGQGSVERAPGKILHWVFRDLFHQIETNNRYSTLGAEALVKKGKSFSFLKLIFKPISKFLETYIVKLGFLDGLPGFIISVGAAYSVFLKFSKVWEFQKIKGSQNPPKEG